MDKYAHRLHDWLESTGPGFEVRLAAHIGQLTREEKDGRTSGGFVQWWLQPVDPSRVVLPGPLREPHKYAARYVFYPMRLKREARRASLVHILDHSYAHLIGSTRKKPVAVTVHDLMPVIILRSPLDGWRERIDRRFLNQALKYLRQANAYVVGTEWLKTELATWLGDDRRIRVVPFGVDRAFFNESPGARGRGRQAWRIPENAFVVLHVGSTVERKNLPLVIQAVAKLRAEADTYLLQVGGTFSADQEHLIDRLGLRTYVRRVPWVQESQLRRAYRAADVLLFPSLYEGFGFPLLEAFASGLPVVASSAGGLREVADQAAVVVDSRDAGAYVQAVLDLAGDEDARDALVERARARAAEFTWRRTAERTADVYREVIGD
jgi:glycosyltransferase involved in cell wall biosynthesis